MKNYQGKGVSGGIAIGRIQVYQKKKYVAEYRQTADPEAEIRRFSQALDQTSDSLEALYSRAVEEVGEEDAAIFQMHRLMLQDVTYREAVEELIREQQVTAEYAVTTVSEQFFQMFSGLEDEYMRARAEDVRDVSQRLMEQLFKKPDPGIPGQEPVILVASDLTPSETVQMDKKRILAFVTQGGSAFSHTAILARTMGIPAIVCTPVGQEELVDGAMAVADGTTGIFTMEPTREVLEQYRIQESREKERKEQLRNGKGQESVTLDGQKIRICANMGHISDLDSVLGNDAEGIGLFRSEFLYLEKDTFPTEEEQFTVYKKVLQAMSGRQTVIRTLDIGADKTADYFQMKPEENPALGCRAIRICLTRPEILKTQLRALFRASAFGNISIMYPMITSLGEVHKIKAMVEEVKEELAAQGYDFGQVEQGIMIETPAAVMISDLLAKEVDFFSIGTNDLTQYTLAIDRQNQQLEDFYDAHHKAVLRMINQTVQNAHREHIWCGICGELGADPQLTELFLAMGIDEISVAPGRVLEVRKTVRETNMEAHREEILKRWL